MALVVSSSHAFTCQVSLPFCVAASVVIQPEAILTYRDGDMHHMGRSHGILDRSNSVSRKERAADF